MCACACVIDPPVPPILLQESQFPRLEPKSKDDAQRLWQMERESMQDTLRQQKEQMKEDKKWLEKEERLLVGNRASFTLVNPLSVSVCHTVVATRDAVRSLARSRHPASLELNVALITVPTRGSVSVLCKMNLPVLLQDPMGPEDAPGQLVSVCLKHSMMI